MENKKKTIQLFKLYKNTLKKYPQLRLNTLKMEKMCTSRTIIIC